MPIAAGLTMDRYGRGSVVWTVPAELADTQALIRVTGHAGTLAVQDVSDEAFLIANGGQDYYLNIAGDTNLEDNQYTTAAGNDANSGKRKDAPMASLSALLSAYDLDDGDVIYVDTGVYALSANVVIGAEDSGVTIQGPTEAGRTAVLNRGNKASGSYGLQLAGADNVTVSHMALTGGAWEGRAC